MPAVVATEQRTQTVFALRGESADPIPLPPGGLSRPSGLVTHPDGFVVVADTGNRRLAVRDLWAGTWSFVGGPGSPAGEFDEPTAAALDAQGRIVVVDSGSHRVVRLDGPDGAGWVSLGHVGRPAAADDLAPYAFAHPSAVTVDAQGRIVVADPGNARLVRFPGDAFVAGEAPDSWEVVALPAQPLPATPYGVARLGPGLVVTDVANRVVHVLGGADEALTTYDVAAAGMAIPAFVAALGPDLLALGDPSANEVRLLAWADGALAETARLRGSDPRFPRPLFERLGGLAALNG